MNRIVLLTPFFLVMLLFTGCSDFFIGSNPLGRTNPDDPNGEVFEPDVELVFSQGFEVSETDDYWDLDAAEGFDLYPPIGASPHWGQSANRSSIGTYSAYCVEYNNGGNQFYQNNIMNWGDRTDISLAGYVGATLFFDLWYDLEPDYDFFTVYVYDQNGVWHNMKAPAYQDILPENSFPYGWTGSSGGWIYDVAVDMSDFCGQTGLTIRFLFRSDESEVAEGVYIDYITLEAY